LLGKKGGKSLRWAPKKKVFDGKRGEKKRKGVPGKRKERPFDHP